MKHLIPFLLFLLSVLPANIQHQIAGILQDNTDKSPISYATVTLFQNDSSSLITGSLTDKSGCFTLKILNPGKYLLQFSYIGYEKRILSVSVPQQSELGLTKNIHRQIARKN